MKSSILVVALTAVACQSAIAQLALAQPATTQPAPNATGSDKPAPDKPAAPEDRKPKEPQAAPSPEAIAAAIERLADDKVSIRDDASQLLWEAGIAAESALRKAATSTDAEVRYRARAILERFRFGLFANTPEDVINLIQAFRNGNSTQQATALEQLAEKQQYATLFTLIGSVTDEAQRTQLVNRFLNDPTSVIGQLLLRGNVAEAEKLMELGATSDQGMLGLAAYCASTGKLDEKIVEVREQFAKSGDVSKRRLLAWLLRARGDLSAAADIARAAADPVLERALLFEAGRWADVARLFDQGATTLPIPLTSGRLGPDYDLIEKLGYGLAFHKRAGNTAEADKLIEQIKQFAVDKKQNSTLVWYAAEALLINGRFEDGMRLTRGTNPTLTFDLLAFQQNYHEAFQLIGLAPNTPINDAWWEKLPIEGNVGTEGQRRLMRIRTVLYAARVLNTLGQKQRAEEVLDLALAQANKKVDKKDPFQGSADQLLQIAQTEYRMGLVERAMSRVDAIVAEQQNDANFLTMLFNTRAAEAMSLATVIRKTSPEATRPQVMIRVHRAMSFPAPADEPPGEFTKLTDEAFKMIAEIAKPEDKLRFVESFGAACVHRGQLELAQKFFEQTAAQSVVSAQRLGDLMAERERWGEAADWYSKAWDLDHRQPLSLFLGGLAREKAGDAEQGRIMKRQAHLVTLGSRPRLTLAQGLLQRGYEADAVEQLQLVMRTSPPEHYETNEAARVLGDLVMTKDPALSAQLWERHMLSDLRVMYNFREYESYLRFPALIHKARAEAAIKANDFDLAGREIEQARLASPNDVRLAEDLVPLLEKAGRKEQADALFNAISGALSDVVLAYPDSALHQNNLAWVSARCHRNLDDALEHAEHAVRLMPNWAGYVDTLAEVHFHRGNREEAVRLGKKAVEMSPRQKSFRDQLTRFESAPIPTR